MNDNDTPVSNRPPSDQIKRSSGESSLTMSKDAAFHLLQNSRRRAVLQYLLNQNGEKVAMREVTEQVAAWETNTTVAKVSSAARQRVYVSLYQIHLPKLSEVGVIEYNRDRGVIVPTALVTVLEPYLG